MLDLTVDAIERMIQEQSNRNGYPKDFPALPELPAARYFDAGFAALEMEHLWLKSWLLAGHLSEIPTPGSYKLFERLGRSVIITRGRDDETRAFNNSCRHRSSLVMLEPKGKATRFVCPYHGWTYGSDGRLLVVPSAQEFACLDKAAKGLVPDRCETWRGFIFINFDSNADPLEDLLEPVARLAAAFPLEQFAIKNPHTYQLDCNWNVGMDNTLEVYHVPVLHSESLAPFLDGASFSVGLLKNGQSVFITRKKSATIFAPRNEVENVAGALYADYNICLSVFPNSYLLLDATGFVTHSYWPDGPSRCVIDFSQYGLMSDDEEYFRQLHTAIEPVLDEDWRLFGRMQRSLESGGSATIPISYPERAIYWLQEEKDRRIGSERIPDHLRVREVLAPFSDG
jgi:phenylpropionate dioxygenase-like ring-hydroxylating dioxygenase large terminal subunit